MRSKTIRVLVAGSRPMLRIGVKSLAFFVLVDVGLADEFGSHQTQLLSGILEWSSEVANRIIDNDSLILLEHSLIGVANNRTQMSC